MVWNKDQLKTLFDPARRSRRTGRSTVMRQVFCELAKENPGIAIPVFDHILTVEFNKRWFIKDLKKYIVTLNHEERKSGSANKYEIVRLAFDPSTERYNYLVEFGVKYTVKIKSENIIEFL